MRSFMTDHKATLDQLIQGSSNLFKQFLLAHTSITLGHDIIGEISDDAAVGTSVGLNISIEPIPVRELKQYKPVLPQFLLETFHDRLVQLWNRTIAKLFRYLIELHFNGIRPFVELKNRRPKIDFRSSTSLDDQIMEALSEDFEFQKYSERVMLLNSVFNPENNNSIDLRNIHKHVHVRNCLQHKEGHIDSFFLKDLGLNKIDMLDHNAKLVTCNLNDRIILSVPEFDGFRRSLLLVGQVWRTWNV